ncbi:inactive serine protease 54 [Pseudophryne corroboree]|uniref:inactive serine protease 54 n=1 Tax=Pseudophryne corroboree TaxID=495146 RepID=UPI00308120E3
MEKRFHVKIWCLILALWTPHSCASCSTYRGFVADVLNKKLLHLSGFPWLVSIQDLSGCHLEVGTIISEFWIVAAPSGLKMSYRKALVGVVGITELESKELEGRPHYPIRKVIVHQNYDEILLGHDLMLLMTEGKIIFGRNVQPVCFPSTDPDNSALTNCQVSGWRGAAGISSSGAWHRLSVDNVDPCPLKKTLGTECCSHHAQDSDAMVTEGDPVSCRVVGSNRWVLAGILTRGGLKSYGPFLYTRTSYFSDWVSACTKEEGEPFTAMVTINTVVRPGPHLAQMRSAASGETPDRTKEKETLYYDYYNGNEPVNSHGHQPHPRVPLMLCIVLLATYIKINVL